MTTATRVLEVARSQLGTVESPANSNRTKYGKAYGMDGYAWCDMFRWWVLTQAGVATCKSAYTPATFDWYKKQGRLVAVGQPGDIGFMDFPDDGVNRISHIVFIEKRNPDGSYVTIEGNTSPGIAGSQRDGGGVYRRTRKVGFVGFARPHYAAPAKIVAPVIPPALATLREGSPNTSLIKYLQTKINADHSPNPRLVVDGDFGAKTTKAVKDIQTHFGLKVDGVVGPATWARI